MTKLLPLSLETCRGKYWKPPGSCAFTGATQLASVAAAELGVIMHTLPLVFIQQEQSFNLAGLLAFSPNDNVLVNDQGQWLGSYVPACFRGHPFKLAKIQAQNATIVCVDEDSGLVNETEGVPFFDQNNTLDPRTQSLCDFLQKLDLNMAVTQRGVAALAEAGVICPWPLQVKINNQEISVPGLHKIDEEKLNRLDDQTFLGLRTSPALAIAYAQLYSIPCLAILRDLHARRSPKPAAATPLPDSLDGLFGNEQSEQVSFDWLNES